MKDNFLITSLKDIALSEKGSIISGPFGSNISSKFFQDTGVPVIRGNNLSNGLEKFIDKGFAYLTQEKADELNAYAIVDDLIFTAAGTIGQVGLIESKANYLKYVISNKQIRVRLDSKKINPLYAYYWFSSPWMVKDIINKNTGSTVPLINLGIIRSLEIKLPKNREYQDKIAHLLFRIDSKIELNKQINAELESMAKTLYDYWFVQFDFPNENGKPYKTSGGKMIWNEELKREIPEGWEVKKVKEIANTGSGSTPIKSKKEYYIDGKIPWINSGEVNNPFIIEAKKYITKLGLEKSSTKLFKRGTLLMAMYGATAGKVSILDIEACTNQAICTINVHLDLHRNYLKFVLEDLYEYLINLSSGSARDNLSQDRIKELNILTPKVEVIKDFDRIISPVYEKVLNSYRENQKLAELRDWLLPMLMNGQVKVN